MQAQRSGATGGEPELDEVTLRRAQRGDEAACRALVLRYQHAVFALLSRMLGPSGRRGLVEDLAQETFLRVFRALAAFSPLGPARLSTWILTIAARLAVDELRRPAAPAAAVAGADTVAGPGRADDATRRAQLGRAIERAVGELPAEYRAAFLLREYHELAYDDIARALEVDIGTVKSRLSRARTALRAALAEVHDE
jgi:RNA polymerase sigma-70 factor (ECF subfamily)